MRGRVVAVVVGLAALAIVAVVGVVIALLATNSPRVFEVYWAAQRSGLYITAVNHHLTADEVTYIVRDSGAKALVVSASPLAAEYGTATGVVPTASTRPRVAAAAARLHGVAATSRWQWVVSHTS